MTEQPQGQTLYELPMLPLRDVVVFPHMVVPLFVGREKSINALEAAMEDNKQILLVAQKDAETDDPGDGDLTAWEQSPRFFRCCGSPDGTVKVLVEGCACFARDPDGRGAFPWRRGPGDC